MKTKTLLLVIIPLSMAIFASSYVPNTAVTKEVPLSKAIKSPDMVQQMYLQLDDSFICDEANNVKYSNNIYYLNTHYIVTGTIEEWVLLFLMDLLNIKICKSIPINKNDHHYKIESYQPENRSIN